MMAEIRAIQESQRARGASDKHLCMNSYDLTHFEYSCSAGPLIYLHDARNGLSQPVRRLGKGKNSDLHSILVDIVRGCTSTRI